MEPFFEPRNVIQTDVEREVNWQDLYPGGAALVDLEFAVVEEFSPALLLSAMEALRGSWRGCKHCSCSA